MHSNNGTCLPGQERYKSLAASYFRGAMGILVCYDASSQHDQIKEVRQWLEIIQKSTNEDPSVVLVGTKLDKCQFYNGITNEEYEEAMGKGESIAKELDLPCILTSSILNVNVRAAFVDLVHTLKLRGMLRPSSTTLKNAQSQIPNTTMSDAARADVVYLQGTKEETLGNAQKPANKKLMSCAQMVPADKYPTLNSNFCNLL